MRNRNHAHYPAAIHGTLEDIDRYVAEGIPPGDFLRAVLENNLKESFARADSVNREHLFWIVSYIYSFVPSLMWGNPERVKTWIEGMQSEKEKDQKDA